MTQVDSRIAMGVQPLDVGGAIGKGYQLRDLAAQADERQLDTQLKQQAVKKQATLGEFHKQYTAGGKLDRAAFSQRVADEGYGADLPAMQKEWASGDEVEAKTQLKRYEGMAKQIDMASQVFGSMINDPNLSQQTVVSGIGRMVNMGLFSAEQGAQIVRNFAHTDPAAIRQELQRKQLEGVQAKDQIDRQTQKLEAIQLGGHTQLVDTNPVTNPQAVGQTLQRSATMGEVESARHNRASEGLTARGQNMTDSRAREANQSGKAPSGYRWSPDGQSLVAIAGGPASKGSTATEGERKAATLLQRLEGSQAQLQTALGEKKGAAKPGLITNGLRSVGLESAANSMTGEQRQRVEAAQLDILDAALTLGTGAAYTREQLEGYRRAFFPQIGDADGTVSDKKARLENVISSARIAAGRAGPGGTGGATGSWGGGGDQKAAPAAPGASSTINFSDLK